MKTRKAEERPKLRLSGGQCLLAWDADPWSCVDARAALLKRMLPATGGMTDFPPGLKVEMKGSDFLNDPFCQTRPFQLVGIAFRGLGECDRLRPKTDEERGIAQRLRASLERSFLRAMMVYVRDEVTRANACVGRALSQEDRYVLNDAERFLGSFLGQGGKCETDGMPQVVDALRQKHPDLSAQLDQALDQARRRLPWYKEAAAAHSEVSSFDLPTRARLRSMHGPQMTEARLARRLDAVEAAAKAGDDRFARDLAEDVDDHLFGYRMIEAMGDRADAKARAEFLDQFGLPQVTTDAAGRLLKRLDSVRP